MRVVAGTAGQGLGRPPVRPAKAAPTAAHPLPAAPPLPAQQLLRFERKGHVAVRGLFTPAELEPLVQPLLAALRSHELDAWRQRVSVLVQPPPPPVTTVAEAKRLLKEKAAEHPVGFLQVRAAADCTRLRSLAASSVL